MQTPLWCAQTKQDILDFMLEKTRSRYLNSCRGVDGAVVEDLLHIIVDAGSYRYSSVQRSALRFQDLARENLVEKYT